MPRPLQEQVVVITGASSGIGRETALQFGSHGASVVLAARSWEPLRRLADEIEEQGGKTYIAVTDVSQWEQVRQLADTASGFFGRIDTWVNAAAVTEYAPVDEMSPEEIQQVIQVTMMGQIFGMKAVLPHMKREEQGTIINIASMLDRRSFPLLSAYSAAKQGIRGFTESLRLEISRDFPDIHITLITPSSVNTPLFEHARSRLDVLPAPPPPVYQPNVIAEAILFAAVHPRKEITVGSSGRILTLLERVSPKLSEGLMRLGGWSYSSQKSEQADTGGDNLFQPMADTDRIEGPYGDGALKSSLYTRLFEYHPVLKGMSLAAFAAGLGFLFRRLGRSRG